MNAWQCIPADLREPHRAGDFLALLEEYARDPMGGGDALSAEVKTRLLRDLPANPAFHVVLAYDGSRAIGLANALMGYSTFQARPLLNVHDIVVTQDYRGRGVAQSLLAALEREARGRGCCKLTLEVLQGNAPAQRAYRRFGFTPYELDPAMGQALFWHKPL